ncbi:MAG TPA: hypothetical protein PLK76_00890 [bacterium]|nr:hypothetical protein [bacterium]
MSLSKYLTLMTLATLLCWASFIIVVNTINPFNTAILGFVFFYSSLFLSLIGTLSILGFLLRNLLNKNQFISVQIMTSFRQSIWLALMIVIGLYLQSQKLVAWWNLLILILLMILLEFYFIYQSEETLEKEN